MSGVERIAAERRRQIEQEGWAPSHDDAHEQQELALAAICYASPVPLRAKLAHFEPCGCREMDCPHMFGGQTKETWRDPWPWDASWDKRKKHDHIRRLEIAGALIAAEIDRLERAGTPAAEEEK
jgi:hypothetical protein